MQDLPARTELHPFTSLTLTDRQFLLGESAGPPTPLAGLLSLAQGATPQPVVLLVHGSGGIGPSLPLWQRQINALGMGAFLLDGFTGRGLTSTSQDQAALGRLAFIHDIYRALEVLARHPAVDAKRVVVMGFSRGGQAALYSAMARFHRLWNRSGITPALTIPVYPDCATRYLEDAAMVAAPIRIHHGIPDDMNPIAPVRAHVARLVQAGVDVELAEYAEAHHGFDNPLSPGATEGPAQSVRDCRIGETAPGELTNLATGQPFTYQDDCVARRAHVGGHAAAGVLLRQAVAAQLKALVG
ncbi:MULTISPECIES: dienelactone hydrolase family protein [Roseomonadaceae]|uniref:Dienelactone hydrolase family protein n=1 Tax=Falsiroseomonas oleicola TaxID=2801474 RepID=A0ABS6H3Z5_9PROT|nr:dienelactone hydrolase family protein [Roseomonas oleicola]MBU8543394.1 dienelactone hydrolase family protein [Roseomonas oleicola]